MSDFTSEKVVFLNVAKFLLPPHASWNREHRVSPQKDALQMHLPRYTPNLYRIRLFNRLPLSLQWRKRVPRNNIRQATPSVNLNGTRKSANTYSKSFSHAGTLHTTPLDVEETRRCQVTVEMTHKIVALSSLWRTTPAQRRSKLTARWCRTRC